eukprot:366432-Chlamydomonas_euryale.AAC.20
MPLPPPPSPTALPPALRRPHMCTPTPLAPQVGFNASSTASKTCNQCPAGTISVNTANPTGTDITVLTLNYKYGVAGGETCADCPAGYYQPVPGGHVCLPCPPGEGPGVGVHR